MRITKTVLLLAVMLSATAQAEGYVCILGCGREKLEAHLADPVAFDLNAERRRTRVYVARSRKAEIAASRPPARGWLAIRLPLSLRNIMAVDPVGDTSRQLRYLDAIRPRRTTVHVSRY